MPEVWRRFLPIFDNLIMMTALPLNMTSNKFKHLVHYKHFEIWILYYKHESEKGGFLHGAG